MTRFQELIDNVSPIASDQNHRFHCAVDASWLQGRTAFGGLTAALLAKALNKDLESSRRLRALSVNFIGPTSPGNHEIHTRSLRDGGSVSHRYGELICNGDIAVNASAAFGVDRASTVVESSNSKPEARPPEDCQDLPQIDGVTPAFTQHFDIRLAHGAWPFSGSDTADYAVWIRFKDSAPIDIYRLIALGDVPPIPGLNRVKFPSMGSSLSWYLECPNDVTDQASDDWWYYDYRCQAAANAYYHNSGQLWAPNGKLALLGRQVAMIFEK